MYEPDDGVEGGWSHKSFGRAIGWALGKKVVTLATPQPLLQLAARIDQFSRREKAKLTADRVNYRSEEHTSELQSLMRIPYAVFCLKKKIKKKKQKKHNKKTVNKET